MKDNLLDFKKRVAPEWYENGPVKTFTKEEIDEWEKNCDPRLWAKYNSEMQMSVNDRKFLDGLAEWQAEDMMEDLMQGVEEGVDKDHKGFVS